MRLWIKKHWLAIVGGAGSFPSLWSAIKWALQELLEKAEHIEFLANRWRDFPEMRQMIENLPALPPWIGVPILIVGLLLIGYDMRRVKTAVEPVAIQKTGTIEICFRPGAPYEISEIIQGRIKSTVRIGIRNSGGSPLSNCRVYIESVSLPPAHAGLFSALLNGGSFVLRHDEPEKLIDIAVYFDHLKKYKFATPIGGLIAADTLNYIDEMEQRSFVVKVAATECNKSTMFKILVDETKKLRLRYIGEAG
jgi:hypothetical protein